MAKAYRSEPRAGLQEKPPPGDELWDQLGACHRLVRAELRAVVLRHGVYLSEYRALGRLRSEARTPSQLAESLGLTPASMTDLARQLVKRGWVKRQPNPSDRRSRLLEVTEAGKRVHAAARREYRTRLAEVYLGLSPRARRSLDRGLRELYRVLAERPGVGKRSSTAHRSPSGRSKSMPVPPWPARPRRGSGPTRRRAGFP